MLKTSMWGHNRTATLKPGCQRSHCDLDFQHSSQSIALHCSCTSSLLCIVQSDNSEPAPVTAVCLYSLHTAGAAQDLLNGTVPGPRTASSAHPAFSSELINKWPGLKKKRGSKLSCITQLYYHGLLPPSNPYIPFRHPPIWQLVNNAK